MVTGLLYRIKYILCLPFPLEMANVLCNRTRPIFYLPGLYSLVKRVAIPKTSPHQDLQVLKSLMWPLHLLIYALKHYGLMKL